MLRTRRSLALAVLALWAGVTSMLAASPSGAEPQNGVDITFEASCDPATQSVRVDVTVTNVDEVDLGPVDIVLGEDQVLVAEVVLGPGESTTLEVPKDPQDPTPVISVRSSDNGIEFASAEFIGPIPSCEAPEPDADPADPVVEIPTFTG